MKSGAGVGVALAFAMAMAGCMGDPCDDAWEPDLKRGPICAGDAARCAQVRMQPDRQLQFSVNVATVKADGKPSSSSDLKHRATCVADFMRQRGVSNVTLTADNATIFALGTLRRIGPVLDFTSVANFSAQCGQAGCGDCAVQTPAQCAGDAFCRTLNGRAVDAQNQCLLPPTGLGCIGAEAACGQAQTWAKTTQGVCHLFSDTCLPTGWSAAADCAATAPPACMM